MVSEERPLSISSVLVEKIFSRRYSWKMIKCLPLFQGSGRKQPRKSSLISRDRSIFLWNLEQFPLKKIQAIWHSWAHWYIWDMRNLEWKVLFLSSIRVFLSKFELLKRSEIFRNNMSEIQEKFIKLMGIKKEPNDHEKALFRRAQKYIPFISWIPGVQMIAVVNSLSMYATHKDSDIDLFIITKPGYLWLVRIFSTWILNLLRVRRAHIDIAENFCLSFFITEKSMDFSHIALPDDIYLENWIRYLKPIFTRGDIYDRFLSANIWVRVSENQKSENLQFVKNVWDEKIFFPSFWKCVDTYLKKIFLPRTLDSYKKKWRPFGVIISDDMLKFHDQDQRWIISEKLKLTLKKFM